MPRFAEKCISRWSKITSKIKDKNSFNIKFDLHNFGNLKIKLKFLPNVIPFQYFFFHDFLQYIFTKIEARNLYLLLNKDPPS